MKVSEVTIGHVSEYLRIDEEDCSSIQITAMLDAAKSYISNYTGLSGDEMDNIPEFYTATMVLCQDMYDNRCYYVERNNVNKVVSSILDMHRRNLV